MAVEDRKLEASAGRDADPLLRALYVATDPNPLLTGRQRYAVYDEMRRSDPAVRAALALVKYPLLAANWRVLPASSDPVDEVVADACRWQLGLDDEDGPLDQTWQASLAQALLCLDWGAMWEEVVFARDVEAWRDADGAEILLRPIARLAPRAPATIQRVDVDPATGRIVEVEQDIPGAKPMRGDSLCRYFVDRDPGDYAGTALTRAMYGAWRLKKLLLVASGIGWDRHSAGVPVVRFPTGSGSEGRLRAEEIGRTYRNHERGYITFEGPEPAAGADGWDIEIVGGAHTLADPTPLLRMYDEQIAKASLAMFSSLGTSETGSRAVGETLADPFYQSCAAFAKMVAQERQRRVLAPFVAENFGANVAVPRLEASKIAPRSIGIISQALADLANAGFYLADADLQNDVRALLDLPELPDDAVDGDRVVVEGSSPVPVDPFAPDPLDAAPVVGVALAHHYQEDASVYGERAAARVVVEMERELAAERERVAEVERARAEERTREMAQTSDGLSVLAEAVAGMARAMQAAAEREHPAPVVNVAPPAVHVAAPVVHVAAAKAPVVNVAPAQVTVQAPPSDTATPVEYRIVLDERTGRPVGIKPKGR